MTDHNSTTHIYQNPKKLLIQDHRGEYYWLFGTPISQECNARFAYFSLIFFHAYRLDRVFSPHSHQYVTPCVWGRDDQYPMQGRKPNEAIFRPRLQFNDFLARCCCDFIIVLFLLLLFLLWCWRVEGVRANVWKSASFPTECRRVANGKKFGD